jgi:hypothetical protein
MEYAADDINVGYMSCLLFMNSEGTLVDKIGEIKEIKPDNHSGGVQFLAVLKTMETLVSITMNYEGNFDIYATTDKGTASLNDQPVDTLINFLHIFYTNMQHDEDKLLQSAIDKHTYRSYAKKMHYRELFGDDLSGD